MLLLAVACVIWSRAAQEQYEPTDTPLWTRPLVAADAVAFYLWKLVWPAKLAIIYGRTPDAVVRSGAIHYTWVVPVMVAAFAWVLRHRFRGCLWDSSSSSRACCRSWGSRVHVSDPLDHRGPLPVPADARRRAGRRGAGVAATEPARPHACRCSRAGIAIVSVNQIGHWRNSASLYAQVLAVSPNGAFARAGRATLRGGGGHPRRDRAVRGRRRARRRATRATRRSRRHTCSTGGSTRPSYTPAASIALAAPGDDTSWERYILDRAPPTRSQTTQPAGP